jgi:hypothetical protein
MACELLQQLLADGPLQAAGLIKTAEAAGIGAATLRRAKKKLGVRAMKSKDADGGWVWASKVNMEPVQGRLHEGQAA